MGSIEETPRSSLAPHLLSWRIYFDLAAQFFHIPSIEWKDYAHSR
jgi:hypothetical protein